MKYFPRGRFSTSGGGKSINVLPIALLIFSLLNFYLQVSFKKSNFLYNIYEMCKWYMKIEFTKRLSKNRIFCMIYLTSIPAHSDLFIRWFVSLVKRNSNATTINSSWWPFRINCQLYSVEKLNRTIILSPIGKFCRIPFFFLDVTPLNFI